MPRIGWPVTPTPSRSARAGPSQRLRAFRYLAALDSLSRPKQDPAFLAARLSEFQAAATFPMRKHTRNGDKIVDAKQFIIQVALTAPLTLSIEIALSSAGTLKPHEFV